MADEEEYLDGLMELMKQEKMMENFIREVVGKCVPVSALMLREVMIRAQAAISKEERERILKNFLTDVIRGKITPYQ